MRKVLNNLEIFNSPGHRVENGRHSRQWDPKAQRCRTQSEEYFCVWGIKFRTVWLGYISSLVPSPQTSQGWLKNTGTMGIWGVNDVENDWRCALHDLDSWASTLWWGMRSPKITEMISLLTEWEFEDKIKLIWKSNVLYNYTISWYCIKYCDIPCLSGLAKLRFIPTIDI